MLIRAPKVALPSPSSLERARILLERALGPSKVLSSVEACQAYGVDESDVEGRSPDSVIIAESAADIAKTLEIAEQCLVPVTARGAGTGRTGGAVPIAGGIVLATHKLTNIREIEKRDRIAVVEPGVILADFHAACEAEGLFYPPDPNSSDTCALGGNWAENAGGPRAFKYGVTRDYVLGLETAVVGGALVKSGRRTVKGVVGYDVTSLLVGSEGTLGVFTEATLKLLTKPEAVATVMALFSTVRASAEGVTALLDTALIPRCIELLDGATLEAVRAAGLPIDARAGAMLLIELDGSEHALPAELERIGNALTDVHGLVDIVSAQDEAQRSRLWAARKSLSRATRKLAKYKLSEDVVVPRSRVPELLDEVDRIGEATGVRHLAYGHAGDGNLHVNFLWNEDHERDAVNESIGLLMRATLKLGGTISGEHGIGVSKQAYISLEQSDRLIELQRGLKKVFDPKELLNPGKIFPVVGHAAC